MLQAVSFAGIVFMLIGMMDPRARPFVALIALAWLETAISSALLTGDDLWDARWMMRVPIDLTAGGMAVWMTRSCEAKGVQAPFWMACVPSFFIVMLLTHGLFWWPAWNGKQFFDIYAHTLNVLWLLQLAVLATPGGGNLVGIAGAWLSRVLDGWRSNAILVPWEQKTRAIGSYRQDDVGSGRNLHLSIDKRN